MNEPTQKIVHIHNNKSYSVTNMRSSITNKLYEAECIVSININNSITILKDRTEEIGEITLTEAIEKFADILTRAKFKKRIKLFQEPTRLRLIEVMTKVLSGKDIIPKGDKNGNIW